MPRAGEGSDAPPPPVPPQRPNLLYAHHSGVGQQPEWPKYSLGGMKTIDYNSGTVFPLIKKPWSFSHRTRILAVDDEVGFTRLLQLAARQFEICTVNDPLRAIEAATEFRPDLILMDRYMPKMSGDALARSFGEHPKLRHIPIAFVTASAPVDEAGGFHREFHGHPILLKPVSIEQIEQCVSDYVKH